MNGKKRQREGGSVADDGMSLSGKQVAREREGDQGDYARDRDG